MSIPATQRQRALGLYKKLLLTSKKTFSGDERAIRAFGEEARNRFRLAAKETDAHKIDEAIKIGEEVIKVLRQNVVQAKWKDESKAFQLRMTKETELGTNESIKKAREQQISDLKADKGPSRRTCREMAAEMDKTSIFTVDPSSSSSSSAAGSSRAYSTSAFVSASRSPILRAAFSTSAASHSRDPTAIKAQPLPRPVPKFSSVTILADGSSIELSTTSPRRLTTLTRDPTNHPLWNPSQERKIGGDGNDDSGRLGRFRRRFGDNEGAAADAKAEAAADKGDVAFGQEDLDWMSVGGREALAGSPIASKKGAKGKGKK